MRAGGGVRRRLVMMESVLDLVDEARHDGGDVSLVKVEV